MISGILKWEFEISILEEEYHHDPFYTVWNNNFYTINVSKKRLKYSNSEISNIKSWNVDWNISTELNNKVKERDDYILHSIIFRLFIWFHINFMTLISSSVLSLQLPVFLFSNMSVISSFLNYFYNTFGMIFQMKQWISEFMSTSQVNFLELY